MGTCTFTYVLIMEYIDNIRPDEVSMQRTLTRSRRMDQAISTGLNSISTGSKALKA